MTRKLDMPSLIYELALDAAQANEGQKMHDLLEIKQHLEACAALDTITAPQLRAFAHIADGRSGCPGWTILGEATLREKGLIHRDGDGNYYLDDTVRRLWSRRRKSVLPLIERWERLQTPRSSNLLGTVPSPSGGTETQAGASGTVTGHDSQGGNRR